MGLAEVFSSVISAVLGGIAVGIPLYQKMKNVQLQYRKDDAELKEKREISSIDKWKKILEYRDKELESLRQKDEQQDAKIFQLMEKNIECQRSDAANQEKIKNLETKVTNLIDLVKKINPNVVAESIAHHGQQI